MIYVVYTMIAIAMLVMWLAMTEDDDGPGGGKMIPAYARERG
jgi:hypothetical protein